MDELLRLAIWPLAFMELLTDRMAIAPPAISSEPARTETMISGSVKPADRLLFTGLTKRAMASTDR